MFMPTTTNHVTTTIQNELLIDWSYFVSSATTSTVQLLIYIIILYDAYFFWVVTEIIYTIHSQPKHYQQGRQMQSTYFDNRADTVSIRNVVNQLGSDDSFQSALQ